MATALIFTCFMFALLILVTLLWLRERAWTRQLQKDCSELECERNNLEAELARARSAIPRGLRVVSP